MSFFRVVVLFCSFLLIAIIVHAQDDKPQVKHVPAPMTSATSGKEMFKSYCASCHGPSAKGDGPAAAALKSAPRDLTLLTKSNSGKFPSERVMSIMRGQATVTAHGNRDMPVWGPVFWHISQGHESEVQQRIVNLTRYIETLQAK
jgi:mono/diheme cytochrome c family protein